MGEMYFAPDGAWNHLFLRFYKHFAPDGAKKIGPLFTLKSADTSSSDTYA